MMKKEKNFNALAGEDPPKETGPKPLVVALDTPKHDPEALRKWKADLANIDSKFYVSYVARLAAELLESGVEQADLVNRIVEAGNYDPELFRIWWGRNVKNVSKEIPPAQAHLREIRERYKGSKIQYAKRRF